jgi:serine/threonine protein kinase
MSARYTITEALGRNTREFRGVAESSDGHKQDVTIMNVPPNLTRNRKFVVTFLAELRSSLLLKHANIVEILDIAKTPEDTYLLVTEYVDGCDLKTFVARRKRVAIQHAIQVVIECCKALAYAHSLNVVHCDLSPRAILLSNNGEVKIAYFGLAKANSQIESSDPGIVKGKFSYLSPEAASGQPVDHRADVFAAGIVLWELLAGRRLFVGETDYQTVERVREAAVLPIDGLDSALDVVVRRALARDASARFQSAAEFADALAQYAFLSRIKLSAGDTRTVVRDVQREIRRERLVEPDDPQLIARVQVEVGRMTSIIHDDHGDPRGSN